MMGKIEYAFVETLPYTMTSVKFASEKFKKFRLFFSLFSLLEPTLSMEFIKRLEWVVEGRLTVPTPLLWPLENFVIG